MRDVPVFNPVNVMFWGRRKAGKSLMQRVILDILAPGLLRHRWRIQSNTHLSFPGYPSWFCYCSPFLPDKISSNMDSARNSELAIDEITEFTPARMAMSRVNKSAGSFIRQIRKLGCEITSTTQFPTDVDRMMLRQIDLFCMVQSHISDWARVYPALGDRAYVDVYVFDIWGQFWGNGEASRYWPPPIWMADKHIRFYHVNRVWNLYNTFERVARTGADDAGSLKLLTAQWTPEELEDDDLPDEDKRWVAESDAMIAHAEERGLIRPVDMKVGFSPPATLQELFAELGAGGRFPVTQSLIAKARLIDPNCKNTTLVIRALTAAGYAVDTVGGKTYAE